MPKLDPPARLSSLPTVVYGSDSYDDGTATSSIGIAESLQEPLLTHAIKQDEEDEKVATFSSASEYAVVAVVASINSTSDETEEMDRQAYSVKMTEFYCLIIGLIVGCFIQFSSLGANFLMTSLYGYNAFYMKSFVFVSLGWCLVTSLMGVCVLLLLRSLLVTSFYATIGPSESISKKEDFMTRLIQSMEYCFAVGSLIGVCISWTITDLLLGMKAHIVHSLVTLGIALVWCKAVMKFCSDKASKNKAKSTECV